MAACTEHPEETARFACHTCQRLLCSSCIVAGARPGDVCSYCRGVITRLGRPTSPTVPPRSASPLPQARTVPKPITPITHRLGDVLTYVTRTDTLLVLFGLAIVTTILHYALGPSIAMKSSLIVWVIIAGLEASMYFHIVETTAAGQQSLETPDFTSLGDSLVAPLVRYIFTLLPVIVALVWYGKQAADHALYGVMIFVKPTDIFNYTGPATLLVAGIALWPLMTMIAAIGRSIVATYNPVIWVKTLRTFGNDYIIGVLIFYGVLVGETLLLPQIAKAIPIPFVGALIVQFLAYLPMALRARLLGAICQPYFED